MNKRHTTQGRQSFTVANEQQAWTNPFLIAGHKAGTSAFGTGGIWYAKNFGEGNGEQLPMVIKIQGMEHAKNEMDMKHDTEHMMMSSRDQKMKEHEEKIEMYFGELVDYMNPDESEHEKAAATRVGMYLLSFFMEN